MTSSNAKSLAEMLSRRAVWKGGGVAVVLIGISLPISYAATYTVNITGTVQKNTCTISNPPGALLLDTIKETAVSATPSMSKELKFTLTNCGNNFIGVNVRVSGVAEGDYFKPDSSGPDTAEGVLLSVKHGSSVIKPDTPKDIRLSAGGSTAVDLPFNIGYVKDANKSVMPGEIRAALTFELNFL